MASKRPDLFYAYVAHSQVVNPANDLPLYKKVYAMAKEKKDQQALAIFTPGTDPHEVPNRISFFFPSSLIRYSES